MLTGLGSKAHSFYFACQNLQTSTLALTSEILSKVNNADNLQGPGAEEGDAQEARPLPSCNSLSDSCVGPRQEEHSSSVHCVKLHPGHSSQGEEWAGEHLLTMAWNHKNKTNKILDKDGPQSPWPGIFLVYKIPKGLISSGEKTCREY